MCRGLCAFRICFVHYSTFYGRFLPLNNIVMVAMKIV